MHEQPAGDVELEQRPDLLQRTSVLAGRCGFARRNIPGNEEGRFEDCGYRMRETVLDVGGQEIMTSDKVTLRMNALVTYRVIDARKSVEKVNDVSQALYREAQLALRAVVGTREIDALLADKNSVAGELETIIRRRAEEFGIRVISLGIRDIILPGEMKTLLNKVIEARKASEANIIVRREETAAIRSQMNTAKLIQENPSLMRMRELEVLERVAGNSKLQVILGEKGLTERIVNLL